MGTGRAASLFKGLRSGQKSESAAFVCVCFSPSFFFYSFSRLHSKIFMLCLLYSIISCSSEIKSLVAL
jgi:hypothetical protein